MTLEAVLDPQQPLSPSADGADVHADHSAELTKTAVIGIVLRRCGPHVIEATIIPAILFYVCLVGLGLGAAYTAALAWTYGALCVRRYRGLAIPGILVLGVAAITVRTLVAVVSGSAFLYFFQPALGTAAMGLVFLGSIALGRPLIGRVACEFWPIPPAAMDRPGVRRLFRNLTLVWAGVNLASAAATLSLLWWLPLVTFVAVRQVSALGITAVGVLLTVVLSLRTARREGLAKVSLLQPLPVVAAEPA